MKNKNILALLALVAVSALITVNISNEKEKYTNELTLANIEALGGDNPGQEIDEGYGDGDGTSRSACSAQYTITMTSQVLVCVRCEYVDGISTQTKGHCKM